MVNKDLHIVAQFRQCCGKIGYAPVFDPLSSSIWTSSSSPLPQQKSWLRPCIVSDTLAVKLAIWSKPCSKKTASWCLIITLANVDRFSKFFQQGFARKFFMYISQRCPPNLQYVATIPCESRQSKNVTKFSYWTWQLICLSKIKCEILCNLPQKYRTNDFNSMCVQHMKYSLERTKTVHCEDNHGEKIATMQQCSTE